MVNGWKFFSRDVLRCSRSISYIALDAIISTKRDSRVIRVVYVLASFTQLLVGHLLDRVALKTLFRSVIIVQFFALILANMTNGWMFYVAQLLFMAAIFGAIPFSDAMIVRFVDDKMRSRVSGMRLAVSLGVSSLAVWMIGPIVKAAGFSTLIGVMVATSCITFIVVSQLPSTPNKNS